MGAAWVGLSILHTIRNIIPNKPVVIPLDMGLYFPLGLGEGGALVECVVDDESASDILLGCGLVWVISFLTGELRTGAGWASSVMALSRSDVLAETRPVAGVLALDMGLDGGLSKLQIPAVSTWALELISPGLPAAIS